MICTSLLILSALCRLVLDGFPTIWQVSAGNGTFGVMLCHATPKITFKKPRRCPGVQPFHETRGATKGATQIKNLVLLRLNSHKAVHKMKGASDGCKTRGAAVTSCVVMPFFFGLDAPPRCATSCAVRLTAAPGCNERFPSPPLTCCLNAHRISCRRNALDHRRRGPLCAMQRASRRHLA